ncbi:MAG: ATP-binding protein [Candidatus Competibacterales bacterium]|nr:ATP-binding protein [Candidatus Competibacterales bacterium]
MNLEYARRLLRTTAFRTALLYACVFSLVAASGLGFTYWSTERLIQSQVDARLRLETEVLLNLYRNRSLPALLDTIQRRSREEGQRIFFYLLWSPERQRLAGQPRHWPSGLDTQRSYATLELGELFQVRAPESKDLVRVLVTTLPDGYRLLVGRDLHDEEELLAHTLSIMLSVVTAIFALALLGSAVLGHYTLRRIDAVSRTAGEIMAGDLTQRIPLSARDNEFDHLGRNLNAMLSRIEQLLAGMRQVTDNVAHDLRKPLNRLRNRLEVTLLEARTEEEYRAVLEQSIVDADEMLKTFNALLSIAQAEAGVRRNDWARVELAPLVEDLADLYGAVAEDKGLDFVWQAEPQAAIYGNRQLLAQAVGNLIDNSVKYTPSGGRITLDVRLDGDMIKLRVSDTGPGIPEAERQRVQERFVRLDSARSQPGSGLGLSLVRAVARLHEARLELGDNRPGLCVTLRFRSA